MLFPDPTINVGVDDMDKNIDVPVPAHISAAIVSSSSPPLSSSSTSPSSTSLLPHPSSSKASPSPTSSPSSSPSSSFSFPSFATKPCEDTIKYASDSAYAATIAVIMQHHVAASRAAAAAAKMVEEEEEDEMQKNEEGKNAKEEPTHLEDRVQASVDERGREDCRSGGSGETTSLAASAVAAAADTAAVAASSSSCSSTHAMTCMAMNPRRSSLASVSSYQSTEDSSEGGGGGGGGGCDNVRDRSHRRQSRRRSSVTFSPENETKEIPAVDCPAQRDQLFYRAEDYTQFRKEHMKEKKAEARERAALMMRWRNTFGVREGGMKERAEWTATSPRVVAPSASAARIVRSSNLASSPSPSLSASASVSVMQFAANFRRSVTLATAESSSTYSYRRDGRAGIGAYPSSSPASSAHGMPSPAKPAFRTARLA